MPNSPYIVAELGASHNGNFDRALVLMETAKDVGADAVKLQCWHPERMCVDRNYVIEGTGWHGRKLYDLYQEAFTPWEWFPRLFDHARNIGIDCFASVFDVEALAFLERLNCPRYKIASFEITDLPLIRAVANTGKPIVISTGMADEDEIYLAWDIAEELSPHPTTLLKCTSAYPAPVDQTNLAVMADLRYGNIQQIGLSDHTTGPLIAVAATALGATMIEKHFTLSRADGGPDAGFSAEPDEFRGMVDACRAVAAALGVVQYGPTEAEIPSLLFRRSLYTRRPLGPGVVLDAATIERCIISSRPALGLPPDYPILGRRVTRGLFAGSPLTEADLES